MAFGVFIHRSDSIYDDSPAERYQFPSQYLARAQACIGDWIIYYEPRKVRESRGYFAVAKVQTIIPDPAVSKMYIAVIDPMSYLDFTNPVPFSDPDGLIESGLLNAAGQISGRAQSAVRPLSPRDFNSIIEIGLPDNELVLPRVGAHQFDDEQTPFQHEGNRSRVNYLSSRIVRDRVFRQVVLSAYDERCAVTGLKLINGGGRAEVEAAHIQPVEANGPDIVSNGLALSGTVHWMFDRGLIGIADDMQIMVSRQVNDPDGVGKMINPSGRVLTPGRLAQRPHPHFLKWHRENCFKV
jgi:putative restriction endonuclease